MPLQSWQISVFLFICIMAAIRTEAQSPIANLNVQRMTVVRIRSTPQDRAAQTFSGVYVGKNQQNAFFVTALHPLRNRTGPDVSPDPVTTAQIQFLNGPTYITATVLSSWDAASDLAVIYVPVGELPPAMIPMSWEDPTPEMPVHIIGHPSSGGWTSWTGHVQNEIEVTGDGRLFSTGSDQSLAEGYSGGPVLDSSGQLIGLHLGSYGSYAKNIKVSALLTMLRAWHVPLDNIGNTVVTPPPKAEPVDVTFIWRGMMVVDKKSKAYGHVIGRVTVFIDGKEVKRVPTGSVNESDVVSLLPGTHTFLFESVVSTNKTEGSRSSCTGQFLVRESTVLHPHLTFVGDGIVHNCVME
jgi:hypothetical protein